jgi:hypothetical protein
MKKTENLLPTNAMLNADWRIAKDDFPPFDKNVLGYYELPATDAKKKPTGEVYRYYIICHINEVRQGSSYKYAEWVDSEHNSVTPTHWMELPNPPICV